MFFLRFMCATMGLLNEICHHEGAPTLFPLVWMEVCVVMVDPVFLNSIQK